MRKLAALISVTLLLAVGCKSTDPEEAGTSPTSAAASGEAVVDDRAPGVTDTEVKVGVTYPDFEALGDAVNINHGDYEAVYTAVIDDLNAGGGINGRKVVPVFGAVDPSKSTSTDQVCTALTQDDPVFVALGLFFGESVMCFVNVNETAVIGGDMTEERLAQARAPWFAFDVSTDALVSAVDTFVAEGELDGSVAIFMTDQDQAIYESMILPMLQEADVNIVETSILNSALDPEQLSAEARTAFQKFELVQADTILSIGQGTAGGVFDGLADLPAYRPSLLFTSTNSVNAYAKDTTRDASVFEGAIAMGVYGPPDAYLELGGITEACFDVIRAAGIELNPPSEVAPGDPNTVVAALAACQQIALLEALLEGAGPELNYGTFQTAGYNLGEIELPGEPKPFFYGPPPSIDGDRELYRFVFDVNERAFVQAP